MISSPNEYLLLQPIMNPFLNEVSPSIPIPSINRMVTSQRIAIGKVLERKYSIKSLLGEGLTGQVVSGTRLSDSKPVAIKTIRKASLSITHWKRDRITNTTIPMEIFILRRLSHPNIVEFLEYLEDSEFFYLVMELCGPIRENDDCIDDDQISALSVETGSSYSAKLSVAIGPEYLLRKSSSDLFDYIKQTPRFIPETQIKTIFSQLVDAIQYLHRQGFVHRDIKDENVIIYDGDKVKIVDFGAADRIPTFKGDYFCSFRGTPRYTPPEIFSNPRHRGPEVDIWCLGILLFTLSYSIQPFFCTDDIIQQRFVQRPTTRSAHLEDLLTKMLDRNPETRINVDAIKMHPFMTVTDVEKSATVD